METRAKKQTVASLIFELDVPIHMSGKTLTDDTSELLVARCPAVVT